MVGLSPRTGPSVVTSVNEPAGSRFRSFDIGEGVSAATLVAPFAHLESLRRQVRQSHATLRARSICLRSTRAIDLDTTAWIP